MQYFTWYSYSHNLSPIFKGSLLQNGLIFFFFFKYQTIQKVTNSSTYVFWANSFECSCDILEKLLFRGFVDPSLGKKMGQLSYLLLQILNPSFRISNFQVLKFYSYSFYYFQKINKCFNY